MKVRKVVSGALLVVVSVGLVVALAGTNKDKDQAEKAPMIKGSIKVDGTHPGSELAKMAKITMADAEKIALKDVKGKEGDKKVAESELEVEGGYLIYSIQVKVKGREGIDEVLVDAGNGKVLAHEHEDDEDEAGEGD